MTCDSQGAFIWSCECSSTGFSLVSFSNVSGDELNKWRAEHWWSHSRTLQRSHHRSHRGWRTWRNQVLLFLQKEEEESAPEAQVKEENRENLKHCGHCQVLNGSNYTDSPTPHRPLSLSSYPPSPHLLTPFIPRCHHVPPRLSSLSLSRSQRSPASKRNVAVTATPQQTPDSFTDEK